MKFKAEIDIMPHDALLDPQGKAVQAGLQNLGLSGVDQVRVGKHISISLEADSEAAAKAAVDEACKKLLANLIVERYHFEIAAV
ncbi:MAG: phosphoribosylformylglycinamidine synthase subunit PurS [Sphingobacteriaceae bacterium]|jgi:phosphoribosylformylglycinamidine synthase subunit PurS|nr:phosphoribosylformylglycinamidine synthase subunit PurS [Sphingobacteriaceae bacterium]